MRRFNLHETFVVHQYDFDDWESEPHTHNYFEIIFIENGSGFHTINEIRFPYKKGDVFLLSPQDKHHFEINQKTQFCYFKFTELLFSDKVELANRAHWLQQIHDILHHPNLMPGDVIKNREDRQVVWDIQQLVIREFNQQKSYFKHIISNAISTILSLIARNIEESYTGQVERPEKLDSTVSTILSYVRKNVYNPDLIKSSALAEKFGLSSTYINNYFKKNTGESLHQFITRYKLTLVKHELMNTDHTVSEIAFRLGYTDESHLTKSFKKHFGNTPKGFKKSLLNS